MLITGEPWVQGIFELSVLSLQFFLKSKTFLKNKVYLKICSPCTKTTTKLYAGIWKKNK